MAKRKVAKIGPSTLMVSLPNKWAKYYNIQKGDELDINAEGKRIIIETNKIQHGKKIQLHLEDLNANLIRHLLYSAYRSGNDEIELFFTINNIYDHNTKTQAHTLTVINEVVDRLIGVEIFKQKKDYCYIKEISKVNNEEFNNTLQRIFITLISTTQDIIDATEHDDAETLKNIHTSADKKINKLSDFCLRIINKGGIVATEKIPQYYRITTALEEIGDALVQLAKEHHRKKQITKKTLVSLEALLKQLYSLYCNYKKKHLIDIYHLRNELLEINYEEMNNHLQHIGNKVTAITSEIIALHHLSLSQ